MNKITRHALLAVATALALAACSPAATTAPDTAEATTAPTGISHYPLNTGLQWNYHQSGEALTNTPIITRATGPITHNGTPLLRLTTTGRGISTTRYYSNTSGMQLHREDRPGTIITYNPPIQHMPPSNQLQNGATWSGITTSVITFTDAPVNANTDIVNLEYEYRVIDHRNVTTPAGEFTAFIINRTATDTTNNTTVTQEFWFTPYVGELRTADNLVMTSRNVK